MEKGNKSPSITKKFSTSAGAKKVGGTTLHCEVDIEMIIVNTHKMQLIKSCDRTDWNHFKVFHLG